MSVQLKRRVTTHEHESGSDTVYALYGPRGVVTWTHISQSLHGPVGIHSARPLWEGHEPDGNRCPFLETACHVDSGYLGGDRIGNQWEAASRDDEVIWRELAKWYSGHLVDGAS